MPSPVTNERVPVPGKNREDSSLQCELGHKIRHCHAELKDLRGVEVPTE
jgi:hypothetical protein